MRKKLEGYLSHAEELHDKHLASSEQDRNKVYKETIIPMV